MLFGKFVSGYNRISDLLSATDFLNIKLRSDWIACYFGETYFLFWTLQPESHVIQYSCIGRRISNELFQFLNGYLKCKSLQIVLEGFSSAMSTERQIMRDIVVY